MKDQLKKKLDMLKRYLKQVLLIKRSPESIALGVAVGTFLSLIPAPGLNVLIGVIAILAFRKISKLSLIATFLFWNPVTGAPFYYIGYEIGDFIFGAVPYAGHDLAILNYIIEFSRSFLIGCVIVAAVAAVISYYATKSIVIKYKAARERRRLRRLARMERRRKRKNSKRKMKCLKKKSKRLIRSLKRTKRFSHQERP